MSCRLIWNTAAVPKIKQEYRARKEAALQGLVAELKSVVSVAAPQARTTRGRFRSARVPATPGAPPRKITGKGREGIDYTLNASGTQGVVGVKVEYMAFLERKNHPWFWKTVLRIAPYMVRQLAGTK